MTKIVSTIVVGRAKLAHWSGRPLWSTAAALLLTTLLYSEMATAATQSTCDADPGFHALDFWVGTWRVTVNGKYSGTDVVTKILSGCAVTEDWRDADGGRGKSLFYYNAFAKEWNQVWVTDQATVRGGIKMKRLVAIYPDKGTRFQGILPGPPGSKIILDRTTLRPTKKTIIHQLIEISTDGGSTWRPTFDAVYTRVN